MNGEQGHERKGKNTQDKNRKIVGDIWGWPPPPPPPKSVNILSQCTTKGETMHTDLSCAMSERMISASEGYSRRCLLRSKETISAIDLRCSSGKPKL